MKTTIRFDVVLENAGGELASERCDFEAEEGDDIDAKVDELATRVIEGFVLSIGDTIRIVDLSDDAAEEQAERDFFAHDVAGREGP